MNEKNATPPRNFRLGRFSRVRRDHTLPSGKTVALTHNQILFLAAYARCGTVASACDASGIGRSTYKAWKKKDEAFQDALEDVTLDFADEIEAEAIRRAREGVRTIKFTTSGVPIKDPRKLDPETGEVKPEWKNDPWYYEEEFSDRLLELLLKAKRPQEFRDRKSIEVSGPGGVPLEVDLAIRQQMLNDPGLTEKLCHLLENAAKGAVDTGMLAAVSE